jgi:hypothetical protein
MRSLLAITKAPARPSDSDTIVKAFGVDIQYLRSRHFDKEGEAPSLIVQP